MLKYLILLNLLTLFSASYGTLAGGRPNAFSEGTNAFAGVVNPANAVWIKDRLDIGAFWIHQKSSLDNLNNNPRFDPGKTNLTYRTNNLFAADAALHKQVTSTIGNSSFSIAYYTTPNRVKLHTKRPIPSAGSTPITVYNNIEALSLIFSHKLCENHSIGVSMDYFYCSHLRNGFQNSDTPVRSVSPGNVTNNGTDHSHGIGCTVGWRWRITEALNFGIAWIKKSFCGQYRKYRGYEPHHARNYVPQTIGGGFSYRFNPKFAGRLEVLWVNLGNLPGSNNTILPDGSLNLNKRGSTKSPGPGLRDATYINVGMGYVFNPTIAIGAGFSHRLKLHRSSNFISHSYTHQTIYNILSLATNINFQQHNLFLSFSYGFKNREIGFMPEELGGGELKSEKRNTSLSISWGYKY